MRILLLKFGALGDVLATTPLLRQTRRAFPAAQIDYCVAAPFAIALRDNPHLDEIVTFESQIFTGKKIAALVRLARQLRAKKYDLVFVLDKHWIFALTAWLAGIPQRIGFARDRLARFFLSRQVSYGSVRHEIHCNLDLLAEMAAVDFADVQMEFSRKEASLLNLQRRFPRLRQPYFACCNSGGDNVRERSEVRKMPSESFAELLDILCARGLTVLLGSKQDCAYYETLSLPANVLNLAGKTSLAECSEVIAGAFKMFTTDCGLMHLAATTEVPLCAFFGPTHPKRIGPLEESAQIIWADESRYDSAYQTRGRIPAGPFFTTLDMQSVRESLPEILPAKPQLAVA